MQLSRYFVPSLLAITIVSIAALAGAQQDTLVSQNDYGEPANHDCQLGHVSANGRFITFSTSASNLCPYPTNGHTNVYLRDVEADLTELISVNVAGMPGNDQSLNPSISSNGRFVVFTSDASDLVLGDTNDAADVFVRDRWLGTTRRASTTSQNAQLDYFGVNPDWARAVSADGRYVLFYSGDPSLAVMPPGKFMLFRKDLQTNAVALVSCDANGQVGNDHSGWKACISEDGQWVAFHSLATNLVPGDTNGEPDTFLKHLPTGSLQLVGAALGGGIANGGSLPVDISADGRYVLFNSEASDVVAGDTNGKMDAFLYDRVNLSSERVSLNGGLQFATLCAGHSMTFDARRILFWREFDPLYNNGSLMVYDRTTKTSWDQSASCFTSAGRISRGGLFLAYGDDYAQNPACYPEQIHERALGLPQNFANYGIGGPVPLIGTGGGGQWPNLVPPSAFVSVSVHPVPKTACRISSVEIHGLAHTWIGDLQIVLEDPLGRRFNLVHRPGFTGTGYGSSGDAFGEQTYTIVSPGTQGATSMPTSSDWTAGVYEQSFGNWPDGQAGIFNVPLSALEVYPGTWKLIVFDWESGDFGTCGGWIMTGEQGIPFEISGGGGVIPVSGTGGGGTWPAALPPSPVIEASNEPAPAGAAKILSVEIQGLSHTFVGDLQIVLRGPSGQATNMMHRPGFTGTGFGSGGDLTGGDYFFVDPALDGADVPMSGDMAPDIYHQFFGDAGGIWPSGTNGITNRPLKMLPVEGGTWSLEIYDWAAGDVGSFTSWKLHGLALATEPMSYCTAGTTTHGCSAQIAVSNQPSASYAWPCQLSATGVEGQKNGMFIYCLSGPASILWEPSSTSYLCLAPPRQRTMNISSGGTADLCDGFLTLDWNAWQQSNPSALGQPWDTGRIVYAQAWFRDPLAPKGSNLSNAIELTYQP
jgi:Tol biopolymer transport system component/subtilisin-like proprotein convertase family protein